MSMSSLLRFNFRKLRKQKSLYLCVGIMLGMLLLSAVMYKMIMDTETIGNSLQSVGVYLQTGVTFGLSTIDNSYFVTLIGIVIALAVCDDYEQHTLKNIYARGYTRKQFYFSKLALMLAATTAVYILITLCSFAMGFAFFGGELTDMGKVAALIAIQYIAALANAAFMFMLSTLFKRSGLSIAMAIIIPAVINLILQITDILLKTEDIKISGFWTTSCFTTLANISVSTTNMLICLLMSVIYAVVFVCAGSAIAKKAEV